VCVGCFRPHVRLSSSERTAKRRQLRVLTAEMALAHRDYAEELFDHITIGRKVFDRKEEQLHPQPSIPLGWTAEELDSVACLTLATAFDPLPPVGGSVADEGVRAPRGPGQRGRSPRR
jgi:hypothetical protein